MRIVYAFLPYKDIRVLFLRKALRLLHPVLELKSKYLENIHTHQHCMDLQCYVQWALKTRKEIAQKDDKAKLIF